MLSKAAKAAGPPHPTHTPSARRLAEPMSLAVSKKFPVVGHQRDFHLAIDIGRTRLPRRVPWGRATRAPDRTVLVSVRDVEGPPRESSENPPKALTEDDPDDGPRPVCL